VLRTHTCSCTGHTPCCNSSATAASRHLDKACTLVEPSPHTLPNAITVSTHVATAEVNSVDPRANWACLMLSTPAVVDKTALRNQSLPQHGCQLAEPSTRLILSQHIGHQVSTQGQHRPKPPHQQQTGGCRSCRSHPASLPGWRLAPTVQQQQHTCGYGLLAPCWHPSCPAAAHSHSMLSWQSHWPCPCHLGGPGTCCRG
jgi:hypothetical protein